MAAPPKLFYSTLKRETGRNLASTMVRAFEGKRRVESGTYLGRNQILVNGQRYTFLNETGMDIVAGQTVDVTNVGRRAQAKYAPVAGSGSAGGGSSTTTVVDTLVDHDHLGGSDSGGVLTGYATSDHAHGASQIGQVIMSIDGSTISAQTPLIGEGGWLVDEINGVLLVVDEV